jgi:hypothetical protein
MNIRNQNPVFFYITFILMTGVAIHITSADNTSNIHVWQMQEITLTAEKSYANCYTDVTCWVDLKGPRFSKRIYCFWDGGSTFKARIVAITA